VSSAILIAVCFVVGAACFLFGYYVLGPLLSGPPRRR
jgi:hypothetical protein